MNLNLSTQEEYERSGHTSHDMNRNAEGYIESTPVMNAPAGRALIGYPDPRIHCVPFSFEYLGASTIHMAATERLLDELFVNDVSKLRKPSGEYVSVDNLYLVLLTSGARLTGAYNDIVEDVKHPDKNDIIVKVGEAEMAAKIDDPKAPQVDGSPCWLVVSKQQPRACLLKYLTESAAYWLC